MTPEDLVEIELIKRLKYRYMRCLDQKLWAEIRTCFTTDVEATYSGGAYTFTGQDDVVAFLERSMGSTRFLSSHRVHHPEIDLRSAATATGTWAMDDVVVHLDAEVTIRGAAFYTDEYAKVDGAWLIRRTGYLRSFEELHPRAGVKGLTLTASWWETAGRSSLTERPQ